MYGKVIASRYWMMNTMAMEMASIQYSNISPGLWYSIDARNINARQTWPKGSEPWRGLEVVMTHHRNFYDTGTEYIDSPVRHPFRFFLRLIEEYIIFLCPPALPTQPQTHRVSAYRTSAKSRVTRPAYLVSILLTSGNFASCLLGLSKQ